MCLEDSNIILTFSWVLEYLLDPENQQPTVNEKFSKEE